MANIKMKNPKQMLAEQICKRLADLAQEMGHDPSKAHENLRDELLSLTPEHFQVIYNIDKHRDTNSVFKSIERAVNDNTNALVKSTQGEFEMVNPFPESEGMTNLIAFAPEHCQNSRQQYAALMVIQRFETLIQSIPALTPGRLLPAGTFVGGHSGIVRTLHFEAFAYLMNGGLEDHKLPEDNFDQVLFSPDSPTGQSYNAEL